jgi:predicted transcriptional regulator
MRRPRRLRVALAGAEVDDRARDDVIGADFGAVACTVRWFTRRAWSRIRKARKGKPRGRPVDGGHRDQKYGGICSVSPSREAGRPLL